MFSFWFVAQIGTFHGVCVRMLRESIGKEDFGVDKEFVIYDTQDSLKVIKKVLETVWNVPSALNFNVAYMHFTLNQIYRYSRLPIQMSVG